MTCSFLIASLLPLALMVFAGAGSSYHQHHSNPKMMHTSSI
jgi:hypothetical protein